MKQLLRRPVILLGLTLLPFLFNNCSKIRFESLLAPENNSEKQAESENGTGYGGKLAGLYYHYVPGYVCENRNSPFSQIDYAPAEINSILSSSKESQCLSLQSTIPNTEIDAGSMQNRVIGYGERIFETNSAGPAAVPENPVEIWCVDQWAAPTIEVLSLYNKAENRAETQFFYPSVPKRTEVNPSRMVNQQTVQLTSKYFDLLVDKSKKGLKAGTVEGTLTIFAGAPKQTLQCRLGGYLDARLWPAKALQYDALTQMEWDPLEGLFYTITGPSGGTWGEGILSMYSADGTQRKVLIGNTANAAGVKEFNFSADRKNLFVKAMLTGDATTQLYSLDPKAPAAPRRLNNLLTDWGQFVSGEIVSSPNSDLVYYLDGAQETGGDIEMWLRAVSLTTGTITQINKSLFKADEGVGQFEVSYPLGKVIYSSGFVEHELWITDMLGGNPRKVDLSPYFSGTSYFIEWSAKQNSRWHFINDRYLVVVATQWYALDHKALLLTIDLVSEKVIFHQSIPERSFIYPVKSLPLVAVSSDSGAVMYFDLTTGVLSTASITQNLQGSSSNVLGQQFAASLAIQMAPDLCANGEDLVARGRIDENKWLLIKKGAASTASIFTVSNDSTNCKVINHMVLPAEFLKGIASLYSNGAYTPSVSYGISYLLRAAISQDQRNVLLSIGSRLYLVPTDGHPVIEVYTPLNSAPNFSQIGFVNNSKVFFVGSIIKDYSNTLFLWDVPKY
jgi:hypothetical protein